MNTNVKIWKMNTINYTFDKAHVKTRILNQTNVSGRRQMSWDEKVTTIGKRLQYLLTHKLELWYTIQTRPERSLAQRVYIYLGVRNQVNSYPEPDDNELSMKG